MPGVVGEVVGVVSTFVPGSVVGLPVGSVTTWEMLVEFKSVWPLLARTAIVEPPIAVPAITRVASAELEIPICSPLSTYNLELIAGRQLAFDCVLPVCL